jgi:hypothetical protein
MIRREDVLPRFEKLDKQIEGILIEKFGYEQITAYGCKSFQAWMAEAATVIGEVFPPVHPIRRMWTEAEKSLIRYSDGTYIVGDPLIGVFHAALQLLREGRLGTLLDIVRIEAESELLDQAQSLLEANHSAAATVIAGGALEVHLRSLCDKLGLAVTGDGSISRYDGVIAQARKVNTECAYSVTDSKQVSVWGGLRNDAAHNPGAFSSSKDEVQRMIEGIREFIAKTA